MKSLPYVAFAQKSASGNGYFAIIPIRDGRNLEEHFNAVGVELAGMGVNIDKACKDYVRARFYSYDAERYINPRCTMFVKRKRISKVGNNTFTYSATPNPVSIHNSSATQPPKFTAQQGTVNLEESIARACIGTEYLDICPTYQSWFEVGCALAKELGEKGRQYYHTLSRWHKRYTQSETDSKFDELLNEAHRYNYGSGTIFHYIKQAKSRGIQI